MNRSSSALGLLLKISGSQYPPQRRFEIETFLRLAWGAQHSAELIIRSSQKGVCSTFPPTAFQRLGF